MAQSVWFLNKTSTVPALSWVALTIHTVSNLTMAPDYMAPMDPFWQGAYAF